jgi:hypothetical protein
MTDRDPSELHWLVRPTTIKLLWRVGFIVLAIVALWDFVLHGHPMFWIDGTIGFYSWYGLLCCVAMILFAKGLGVFLKRRDDYYDD